MCGTSHLGNVKLPMRRKKAPSHPGVKPTVDRAFAKFSPTFDRMCAANGLALIPPEYLLTVCLLMSLFSVRSGRPFCKRLECPPRADCSRVYWA